MELLEENIVDKSGNIVAAHGFGSFSYIKRDQQSHRSGYRSFMSFGNTPIFKHSLRPVCVTMRDKKVAQTARSCIFDQKRQLLFVPLFMGI
jgi:hypothetical protein